MARRYRTIDGLGRCAIVLRGISADKQVRVLLLRQTETGSIFVLFTNHTERNLIQVTTMSPRKLIGRLSHFDWEFDLDSSSVGKSSDQPAVG